MTYIIVYMAVTSFIITDRLRHRVLTDIHLYYIYEREGKTCNVSLACTSRRLAGADDKPIFAIYRSTGAKTDSKQKW